MGQALPEQRAQLAQHFLTIQVAGRFAGNRLERTKWAHARTSSPRDLRPFLASSPSARGASAAAIPRPAPHTVAKARMGRPPDIAGIV